MIVAGFGFRVSATLASLQNALEQATNGPIDALAAPADKCRDTCLTELGLAIDVPIIEISTEALQHSQTKTRSAMSERERGTGSVAEAAALAAAGPHARLLTSRHISQDRLATCAIATGPNL